MASRRASRSSPSQATRTCPDHISYGAANWTPSKCGRPAASAPSNSEQIPSSRSTPSAYSSSTTTTRDTPTVSSSVLAFERTLSNAAMLLVRRTGQVEFEHVPPAAVVAVRKELDSA